MKKLTSILLALLLILTLAPTVAADENPRFSYDLKLTDQNGTEVEDLRALSNGDTLNVEIVLERKNHSGSYDIYGIEFRLVTTGLKYNKDGTTLRRGTEVVERNYTDGDSVGFAWYDLQQIGESVFNPTLACKWSYTVTDASAANLKVPVALVYIVGESEAASPTGPAFLRVDFKGGFGPNTSQTLEGAYQSGTVIVLPDAEKGGFDFLGWSDGGTVFPAGSEYAVSGIVTLEAQWAERPKDQHLVMDSNGGGAIIGNVTGHYSKGQQLILPAAPEREGYEFLGWSDGKNIYPPNGIYQIDGSTTLVAQWRPASETEPTNPFPFLPDDFTIPQWVIPAVAWGVALLLLGLAVWYGWRLLLLLPLWKRDYVEYSLKTGDLALNYTNAERRFQVSVVLDEGGRKQTLGKSAMLEPGTHLQFISNMEDWPIANRKPGIYKGKLVIQGEGWFKINECSIKFLDKDLGE